MSHLTCTGLLLPAAVVTDLLKGGVHGADDLAANCAYFADCAAIVL